MLGEGSKIQQKWNLTPAAINLPSNRVEDGLARPTRSLTSTNNGGTITIPRQDHELFKVLNSCPEDVEKAVAALSGRKKKGGNEIELETDDEED